MTPATIQLLHLALDETPRVTPLPLDQRSLNWILDTGLGPLLWHLLRQYPDLVPGSQVERVKSANLSAYMLSAETFDRLDEMLRRAAGINCGVTLLKGVSVALQWYPERHWRPMRDIDVLVRGHDQAVFEQQLVELGYQQTGSLPAEFFAGHQHSMPFFHPTNQCWVEVHTSLFRADSPMGKTAAFKADAIRKVPVESATWAPGSVWRLSDELQLVYTAAHWASKLTLAGGLVPVLDTLLMLKGKSGTLDWGWILEVCRDDTVARPLWLMLSYLEKHEFYAMPGHIRQGLGNGRRSIGNIGLRILHRIIDKHMAAGGEDRLFGSRALVNICWETLLGDAPSTQKLFQLPWRMLFPPSQTGRYHPVRHWKRLKNALNRALK